MSRWWNSRILVGFWPHGITVQEATGRIDNEPYLGYWPAGTQLGDFPWSAGFAALDQWLSNVAPRRSHIEVRLSSHYAQYLVLPWSTDLKRDTEWQALAKARVEFIWGNKIDWDIRLDRLRFESSCVVCAIDGQLTAALLALRSPIGLAIKSIQPHFSASFNELAADVGDGPTLIVSPELDCITIGAADQGAWTHIRTLPVSVDSSLAVDTLVNRERLALGLPADCSVVYGRRLGPALPYETHG